LTLPVPVVPKAATTGPRPVHSGCFGLRVARDHYTAMPYRRRTPPRRPSLKVISRLTC
jgi:hypothetical protein